MAFHNVKLPDDLEYGFRAGPSSSTLVQATSTGHEYRIQRQSQVRHRYIANKALLTPEQWSEVLDFYIGRRGALHSWRFKDWNDFTTSQDGQSAPGPLNFVLGTVSGASRQFQLRKEYDASGPAKYQRNITVPVHGTVRVSVTSLGEITEGTDWTLSSTGGIVTISATLQDGDVVTAGCEFEVPVRFSEKTDQWLEGQHDSFERFGVEIELIEVLDEVETPEVYVTGGSAGNGHPTGYIVTDVDLTMTADTFVWPIAPTVAINLWLPPPNRLDSGMIFWVVIDPGSAGSYQLLDDAGNAIGVSQNATTRDVAVLLSRDGDNATWIARA